MKLLQHVSLEGEHQDEAKGKDIKINMCKWFLQYCVTEWYDSKIFFHTKNVFFLTGYVFLYINFIHYKVKNMSVFLMYRNRHKGSQMISAILSPHMNHRHSVQLSIHPPSNPSAIRCSEGSLAAGLHDKHHKDSRTQTNTPTHHIQRCRTRKLFVFHSLWHYWFS